MPVQNQSKPKPEVDEESSSSQSQDGESVSTAPVMPAGGEGQAQAGDGSKAKSLAAKINALSREKPPSKQPTKFLLGLFALFCVCIPVTLCFLCALLLGLVLLAIPIAEVVIGALYLERKFCPGEESVPLLLILGGTVALTGIMVDALCRCKCEGDVEDRNGERWRQQFDACVLCRLLMKLVLLTWLIWAAVVVFQFYDKVSYEEGNINYCHPLVYRFLFWLVVISLGILLLGVVLICCVTCCVCMVLTTDVQVVEVA